MPLKAAQSTPRPPVRSASRRHPGQILRASAALYAAVADELHCSVASLVGNSIPGVSAHSGTFFLMRAAPASEMSPRMSEKVFFFMFAKIGILADNL